MGELTATENSEVTDPSFSAATSLIPSESCVGYTAERGEEGRLETEGIENEGEAEEGVKGIDSSATVSMSLRTRDSEPLGSQSAGIPGLPRIMETLWECGEASSGSLTAISSHGLELASSEVSLGLENESNKYKGYNIDRNHRTDIWVKLVVVRRGLRA